MASERTTGHTALVTGGTGGLGAAIARALHDAGHAVLVSHSPGNARVRAWLDAQAAEGYRFAAYSGDVADEASCRDMVERIHADGHAVDILVNNAGITRDGSFRKMAKDKWDAVLRTNLDSLFNVTRPLIDDMLERGWGRVVNISSVNGEKGQFGQTNYAAAKAGIHGFTKALAQEVARKGVTVNSVSPGYVETPMTRAMPDEVRERTVASVPVGRIGQPADIARAVAFLTADDAGYITGATLPVNGGLFMSF